MSYDVNRYSEQKSQINEVVDQIAKQLECLLKKTKRLERTNKQMVHYEKQIAELTNQLNENESQLNSQIDQLRLMKNDASLSDRKEVVQQLRTLQETSRSGDSFTGHVLFIVLALCALVAFDGFSIFDQSMIEPVAAAAAAATSSGIRSISEAVASTIALRNGVSPPRRID